MDPRETVPVVINMLPEEAASVAQLAEESAASGGTVSWLVRCACARLGLFGWPYDPDLHFDDDEDDA